MAKKPGKGKGLQAQPPKIDMPKGMGGRQQKEYARLVKAGKTGRAEAKYESWKDKGILGVGNVKRRYGESKLEAQNRTSAEQGYQQAQGAANQMRPEAIEQLQAEQDPYGNIQDPGQFNAEAARQKFAQDYYKNYMANEGQNQATEMEDFEQMAANRGWAPGSEIYQQEKSRLEKQHAQQRENALFQGYQQGDVSGAREYGLNVQGIPTRTNLEATKRYQPITDITQVQSTAPDTSMYYTQGFQGQQAGLDRAAQERMARSVGGGGSSSPGYSMPVIPDYTGGSGGINWGQVGAATIPGVVGSVAKEFLPDIANWVRSW